jgi:hypothetical protein
MNISLAPVQHAYARLAPRERLFVTLAAVASVVVLCWVFVGSIEAAKGSLESGIVAKRRQLATLQSLRGQYLDVKRQTDEMLAKSASQPPNWLYPALESVIKKTIPREKVRSMDPSSKPAGEHFVEDSVAVEINGVTLQQTVGLLYDIEQASAPMHVSRLQMKKRVADPYQFDITFAVSSVKATS